MTIPNRQTKPVARFLLAAFLILAPAAPFASAANAGGAAPLPAASMPPGKLVTLHLTEVTPQAAFAELARQSSFAIEPDSADLWNQVAAKRLSISVDNQPFWAAFFELCRKSDVYPQPEQKSDTIILSTNLAQRINCPIQVVGPFAFVVNYIHHWTNSRPGNLKLATHDIHLEFDLFMEPKLPIFNTVYPAVIEEATDDAGNTLTPQRENVSVNTTAKGPSYQSQVTARMQSTAKVGQRIAKLKGYARVALEATVEKMEVADVLTATQVSKEIGGMTIVFERLEETPNGYTARFVATAKGRGPLVQQRLSNYNQMLRLLDAKGNEYSFAGGGGAGGADSFRFSANYTASGANPPGPPAKIILPVLADVTEIHVPFQFNDLPLP